mmetsp:Transcript_15304/g.30690  ORF Transcript_15304/g.30690 Transcript_15304/m.30690 type:complete len:280 (-) Transcript_15304:234-1073(-)
MRLLLTSGGWAWTLGALMIKSSDSFSPKLHGVQRLSLKNANPFQTFIDQAGELFNISPASTPKVKAGSEYDEDISAATGVLVMAAESKAEDGAVVVDALLDLEKLQRSKAKVDDSVAADILDGLEGAWRLVFTTGTIDMQKKIKGQINYFPIKAVQCFDAKEMKITNSIYLFGDTPVIKFFGPWSFNPKSRKVEFDFTAIAVLGLKFDLPKGGAADIGAATGLGSDNNKELVSKGKKPFFNWISADSNIATARGGGGGLALWKRDLDMENENSANPSAF